MILASKIAEFNINDRVFAKLSNCPYWPARINKLPDYIPVPDGNYPIFFYGTHEVEFLPPKSLVPFYENRAKYIRNNRYQYFTEAMWEIENNPDILALDKDPNAEDFLCDMYDTEKPIVNVPGHNDEQMIESAEINDVDGIMNLEECEWNEIFTIEDQEVHNNALLDNTIGTDLSLVDNYVNKMSIINVDLDNQPLPTNKISSSDSGACYSNELYLSALNSNCVVLVEKLSLHVINTVIKTNIFANVNVTKHCTSNSSTKSTKDTIIIDSKSKNKSNSSEKSKQISSKSRNISEQKKSPINAPKTMSTINKNSVSRIIDAITLDSDDNQSCVIINPIKDKIQTDVKSVKIKSKLISSSSSLSSSKPVLKVVNDKSNGTLNTTNVFAKSKSLKLKKTSNKQNKKDWINKNAREAPLTFEKLFSKSFSILGSGFKISKKSFPNEENNNGTEIGDDEKWSESKKQIDDIVTPLNNNDDDYDDNDDDCGWPKMKDQYDDFAMADKPKTVTDSKVNDNDNEEDCLWSTAANCVDDYNNATETNYAKDNDDDEDFEWQNKKSPIDDVNPIEGNSGQNEFEKCDHPIKDDDKIDSENKWYGDENESEEEGSKKLNNKEGRTDPWINYLSRNQSAPKIDIKVESEVKKPSNIIEIEDDNDNIDSSDIVVKRESSTKPKRPVGNVWSHIKDYQTKLDKNIFEKINKNDGAYEEGNENLDYTKDAKWLYSRNEDFLDSYNDGAKNSYCEDVDYVTQTGKWFSKDKESSSHDVISEHNLKKSDFKSIENFNSAESWVDSGPFKTYKNSFDNHQLQRRQKSSISNFKYASQNSKPVATFQNMTMEQLFPPFKKEYFKNSRINNNVNEHSTDMSPNKTDKPVLINNYTDSKYNPHSSAMNNKFMYQYYEPYSYYGDTNRYQKDSFVRPSAANLHFNMSENSFSKANYFSLGYQNNAAPFTPESPDPYSNDNDKITGSSDNNSFSNPLNKSPVGPIHKISMDNGKLPPINTPVKNFRVQNNYYSNHQSENPQLPFYDDMNYYYYHPYYGTNSFQSMMMYPPYYYVQHPNQQNSFVQLEPSSYTPASPDPEEMCSGEKQ